MSYEIIRQFPAKGPFLSCWSCDDATAERCYRDRPTHRIQTSTLLKSSPRLQLWEKVGPETHRVYMVYGAGQTRYHMSHHKTLAEAEEVFALATTVAAEMDKDGWPEPADPGTDRVAAAMADISTRWSPDPLDTLVKEVGSVGDH